jgi:4-hydroxy-2-oxoheptanedioate aldolase
MRPNRLREIWQGGGAAVNGWLAIANSFSAETMAHQGWDSLTIDLQHGVVDYQAMVPDAAGHQHHGHRAGRARAVAGARHPDEGAGRGRLRRHLPDGQHPRRRAEAGGLHALRAAGTRSFGPVRALLYSGADYPAARQPPSSASR